MIGDSFGWMWRKQDRREKMADIDKKVTDALEEAYAYGRRTMQVECATEIVRLLQLERATFTVDSPLMVLMSKIDRQAYFQVAEMVVHRG